MLDKGFFAKDICIHIFGKSTIENFRSESALEEEIGRERQRRYEKNEEGSC